MSLRRSIVALQQKQLPPTKFTPPPYHGPPKSEVLAQRKQFIHPAIPLYYRDPVYVVQGHMQYLFDEKGTRYLDLFGGVCTVGCGHSHPRIVKVMQEHAAKVQHTTGLYLTEEQGAYAKEIVAKLPKGVDWVLYFVNSGSEANDLATLMARTYTKRLDLISLRNGYHGGSEGTRGITSVRNWIFPVPANTCIHRVMCPNPYRGPFQGPGAVDKYVAELEEVIQNETGGQIAGFIAERIQGVGGCQPLLDGYLKKVYPLVRAAGGVCISDEVQCGWGRLGSHYWGFETEEVVPDIVTMAKSIGNGIPLGAVAARREVAETMNKVHFNTFGGNPVSCAVGREVMRVIEEEGMQQNCAKVGGHFLTSLKALQKTYPILGDVRGKGLVLGLELVKDPETKAYNPEAAVGIMESLKEDGILIGKGGAYGSVLRIQPPMCMNMQDADYTIYCLEKALKKHQK